MYLFQQYLFSAVDHILCVGQAVDTGTADHRVMTRGSVGHLHGAELQKRLSQCHTTEQHLPVGNQHRGKYKKTSICAFVYFAFSYCIRCAFMYLWHT